MAENKPQNYSSHTRFDPVFHFFLAPVFGFTLVFSLIHFFYHLRESDLRHNLHSFFIVLLALALLGVLFKERLYALKVQDRVIRLEERLRLMQILSEPLRSRIPELSEDQLCGLRFAQDTEVPKLVERAIGEKLTRKQIKQAIQNWRPDYWRV
jgi:Family of unknown function (DUF6526)